MMRWEREITFTNIKNWGISITKQIKQDNSLFKYNEQEIKELPISRA